MFNKIDNNTLHDSMGRYDQDLNRGLALLIIIAVSVVGSSWLFSVPVYFDLKIATQILPFVFSTIGLFVITRVKNRYLNILAAPVSYILIFSSWSYVVFLNAGAPEESTKQASLLLSGISNSMYLLGLCLITIWSGRYFKYAIYLSAISTVSILTVLFVFASLPTTYLLAVCILLVSSVILSSVFFKSNEIQNLSIDNIQTSMDEDLLLPAEVDEQVIVPELTINSLPLNDSSVKHDWELILRELHGELRNTVDVDQLFKRMLVFLHGAIEFDSAAVGMLQEKNLKKIAIYGVDDLLHSQTLNWTNQRISELFSSREPILSKQNTGNNGSKDQHATIHRLDIPVISNQKVVGIVTIFKENTLFDTDDVKLTSSIVFHSMIALRQARMQEEIKRLSSNVPTNKLTVYNREQFVSQVKPIFDKLSKPRECSLFILEIDSLDDVIDKIGREAGALLYKNVSNTISSLLKSSDVMGNYGKEGFIVLLDETNLNAAKALAESIRENIQTLKVKFQEHVITTTASIGLTIVSNPKDDLAALMRKADMGLFVAKENGCNSVKVSL